LNASKKIAANHPKLENFSTIEAEDSKQVFHFREPFELNVSVLDKVIPYGFDEASRCDALLLHCYMDKTLNHIGKLVRNNKSSEKRLISQ